MRDRRSSENAKDTTVEGEYSKSNDKEEIEIDQESGANNKKFRGTAGNGSLLSGDW